MIYLDSASTTKPNQEIIDKIVDTLVNDWGNPSNLYNIGVNSKAILEENREIVASNLGCSSNEIFFVSCASEGNAWALKQKETFLCSKFEHHSILSNPAVKVIDDEEFMSIDFNEGCFADSTTSTGYAHVLVNSETGIIFPVLSLFKHAKEGHMFTLCDMTQAIGNIDVKPYLCSNLIDMAVCSLHKLGGPKGIGIVYINEHAQESTNIVPLIYGSQENALRGGTQNTAYISITGLTIQKACDKIKEKAEKSKEFRSIILEKLADSGIEYAINSKDPYNYENIWSTINFSVKGVSSELIQRELSNEEIYIGVGSACNTGLMEKDKVMEALGVPDEYAMGQIRLSFDPDVVNTNDIYHATQRIIDTYKSIK